MITFAAVIFGNSQIDYLYVLLQSIIEVYQEEASIIIYYAGVDSSHIEKIRSKASFVLLKEDKSIDYSDKATSRASFKTVGWCKIMEEQRWPEHLVFLDIDTLVVKKVDKYFDKYFTHADVGYTYKTYVDENLKWPINSGVVLVANNANSLRFFRRWRDKTIEILSDGYQVPAKRRCHLRSLWGGEDQASMGSFLNTRDRKKYGELIVSENILFQGFPCEELNECRCVPIEDKTHIIHYKGKWRYVIPDGTWSQHRPKEKCLRMYELWTGTLKNWNESCG